MKSSTIIVIATALFFQACGTVSNSSTSSKYCVDAVTPKACQSLQLSDFNTFTRNTSNDYPEFEHTGFIVSLDKSKYAYEDKARISSTNTNFLVSGPNDEQIDFNLAQTRPNTALKERINKSFTGQAKAMLVSGIVGFRTNSDLEYNITSACAKKNLELAQTFFDCGFDALNELEAALTSEINSAVISGAPYSHVIFHSTGWHNRQDNSINHYNTLFKSLKASSSGTDFKPLYIGLTWPADWDIKIISYLNKANDADEVGFIWANYILNKTIPAAIENANSPTKPKFVAMGHSFGARVMATAAHSRPYITSATTTSKLDKLILIQPAMSAVRLHANPESKSSRFRHFNYYDGLDDLVENVIVTASARDTTNGFAFWSGGGTGHAGTVKAYKYICGDANTAIATENDRFICRQQSSKKSNDWSHLLNENQLVLYLRLDTKSAMNTEYDENKDAIKSHNNFKDELFTDILFPLIK